MTGQLIAFGLTCGPFVLTLVAWAKLYWAQHRQWPSAVALLALSVVTTNAALAVGTFLYYQFRPPPSWLPPWQDPLILTLGWLSMLAPVGMVVGFVAGGRGAAKWLIWIVETVSVALLVVGVMAGGAV